MAPSPALKRCQALAGMASAQLATSRHPSRCALVTASTYPTERRSQSRRKRLSLPYTLSPATHRPLADPSPQERLPQAAEGRKARPS